ncbi:unnamed protein product [Hymenolepis diminuta]|uniref:Uncharacterized protein n=1 Tax=Hymenolepis diminuta TaxID=6216 RepID=A0A564XX88_HYMDI|nr:unnamed protein product [Hymenolepis diminuta]
MAVLPSWTMFLDGLTKRYWNRTRTAVVLYLYVCRLLKIEKQLQTTTGFQIPCIKVREIMLPRWTGLRKFVLDIRLINARLRVCYSFLGNI